MWCLVLKVLGQYWSQLGCFPEVPVHFFEGIRCVSIDKHTYKCIIDLWWKKAIVGISVVGIKCDSICGAYLYSSGLDPNIFHNSAKYVTMCNLFLLRDRLFSKWPLYSNSKSLSIKTKWWQIFNMQGNHFCCMDKDLPVKDRLISIWTKLVCVKWSGYTLLHKW